MKKAASVLLIVALVISVLSGCAADGTSGTQVKIKLSDNKITVNGKKISTAFSNGVYLSNDIIYYEDRDTYESGNKYGEGRSDERHTSQEASENKVINITKAGTYRLSGELSKGQVRVNLGEEAKYDENAVVNLVLDNVNITCTVAPTILFESVYECDTEASTETAISTVDTSKAGANIIIADDSVNNINGSHVARIYKDGEGEKKLFKQDGAVYSYMSLNVTSETEKSNGVMNIVADNEGLDTELHLTINGGNINILSNDDGINTNKDGVSVTTVNNGNLHIVAGLGKEGDGIDSNGWLVINGGTVVSSANPVSDAGLDSDMGSFINGGTVIALGSAMDWAESDSEQVTMNLQFSEYKNPDASIVVTDTQGNAIFGYSPETDEALGSNARKYLGAIISCPEFKLDEVYNLYVGGSLTGTNNMGVFSEITAYTDGVKQGYTGTDTGNGFGGPHGQMSGNDIPDGQGGMQAPPDIKPDDRDNMQAPPDMKPDSQAPAPPDILNESSEQPPQRPDKIDRLPFNNDGMYVQMGIVSDMFFMQDKVNFFSGVCDMK